MKRQNMRGVILIGLLALLWSEAAYGLDAETVRKKFQESYKDLNIEVSSVRESGVDGVYELVVDSKVLYYAPKSGHVIFGTMFDADRSNLTEQAKARLELEGMQTLAAARSQAVKIGSGPIEIIEVTNPDCGYCRKLSRFLDKRADVTRYVFFAAGEESQQKARYVAAAADKAGALREIMNGLHDYDNEFEKRTYDDQGLIAIHANLVEKANLSATPMLIVNGTLVQGADIPRIEELLKAAAKKEAGIAH